MARVTKLADVAKAAGVSQGTASNVFNRPDLVRAEVRERVESAARRLNYSGPDPKGRLLRAGKVNAIGVVVHERLSVFLEDPHDLIMLRGIAEVLDAHGAGMAMVSAYPDDEVPAWSIKSAVVDGFIVFCLEDDDRLIEETRKRKLPFVAIDVDAGPAASSVNIDDRAGARIAAEHLVGLGHRRFGILSLELTGDGHFGLVDSDRRRSARYEGTRDRIDGYADALAAVGIAIDDVPMMEVLQTREAGAKATGELLVRDPEITAILGMSDLLALGAIDHCNAEGIKVPQRISVVGFDDIPEASKSGPPLTTMHQPIREKGRRAAELVFERGPSRQVILPIELVVRSSTGRPPG